MPKLKIKRREAFAQALALGGTQTDAALKAKYSKNTATKQASFLLTKKEVVERIREIQAKASEKYGISMDRLVEEYKAIGLTNSSELMEYVDERVLIQEETDDSPAVYKTVRRAYLKPHDQLTDSQTRAIQSISETATGGVQIKLHDKIKSLDSMTKILGGFVEKKEIKQETTVTHKATPEVLEALEKIYKL